MVISSIMNSLSSDDLWEIRIDHSSAGDSIMDPNILVTIKRKIDGVVSFITSQYHRLVGIAEDATAVLGTVEEISLDSQIEFLGVKYEIIQKMGAGWKYGNGLNVYALKRTESVP